MPINLASLTRVSTSATGAEGDGYSENPAFSPDGTRIAFNSEATNLVPGDTNGFHDVFVKDFTTGVITRVSTSAAGEEVGSQSRDPVFSPDGTRVAFLSYASNLVSGDTNRAEDIFVKDLTTGAITRVDTSAKGAQGDRSNGSFGPAFSPDGTRVAFQSHAGNLVPGDLNDLMDIFVKDLTTGAITRISTSATGEEADNGSYDSPEFSPDGTRVMFDHYASNLVPGDSNGTYDVFIKDLATGAITRVSTSATGTQGEGENIQPAFSPDGTRVTFASNASNLVPGDSNGTYDIFIKDLATGAITLVSTSSEGVQGNDVCYGPVFSPDGTRVAFNSVASNLVPGDTNGVEDVFIKDLTTGAITRISMSVGGRQGNRESRDPVFSPDGSLAFQSFAINLVPGDTNRLPDIFTLSTSGTAGDDRLLSLGAETLRGLAGDDVLIGNIGDDILDGGSGDDVLDGGAGRDRVSYATSPRGVAVALIDPGPQDTGGAGIDTITNVEDLEGSSLADALIGDDAANRLIGLGGDDVLAGLAGDDIGEGGGGDDAIEGGQGNDALYGQLGDDELIGGAGDDLIGGGGGGDDALDGGQGSDTANYAGASAAVRVSLALQGQIQNTSGAGQDLLDGFENLVGSAFADLLQGDSLANSLVGGAGDDTLLGGLGTDRLQGQAGSDTLAGGEGQDILRGGADADLFFFDSADSYDLIADFAATEGDRVRVAIDEVDDDQLRVIDQGPNLLLEVDLDDDAGFQATTLANLLGAAGLTLDQVLEIG